MPTRVVLDTNTLIECLVDDQGPLRSILDGWIDGQYVLVTSPYLLEELAYTLAQPEIREYVQISDSEQKQLLAALQSQADVTEGALWLEAVAEDPKDNAIVSCAVEGKADLIITGDDALLDLIEYKGVKVITPRRWSVELMVTEGSI